MNTTQAKALAKKFGCTLTFINDDKPGMWFLNAHPDSQNWDRAQANLKANDDLFCFSTTQMKDMDVDTLLARIGALIEDENGIAKLA